MFGLVCKVLDDSENQVDIDFRQFFLGQMLGAKLVGCLGWWVETPLSHTEILNSEGVWS